MIITGEGEGEGEGGGGRGPKVMKIGVTAQMSRQKKYYFKF